MKVSSAVLLLIAATTFAQEQPSPAPTGHDISQVDTAPLGGAIAIPIPEEESKRLRKYDIPELVGARQAIGPQLIDGRLPHPLLDYAVHNGRIVQRLSLFEGGLAVLNMTGAGGTIRKKLILPSDALLSYLKPAKAPSLRILRPYEVPMPMPDRYAEVRAYDYPGAKKFELKFDPVAALPKALNDVTMPLSDLLRAMSEDRTVTNSVANYEPKVGDELIGDDRKTYRVSRMTPDGVVELHCVGQPTIIYVDKKDLYNYFIGARGGQ